MSVSPPNITLTRDEARWLAVHAQGLGRKPSRRRPRAADLLDTIERIGCLQLDTISVISRSHETVLWSRLGPYDLADLDTLFEPCHALTEYWAHAAAIIPSEHLRRFRPFMERHRRRYAENGSWAGDPENRAVMDSVVEHIRANGPTASRDFERPQGVARAAAWEWYGNKPQRRALGALWTSGEIVLRHRDRGFARIFDLPENVAPELWDSSGPELAETQRTLASHALSALGVATPSWTSDYFRAGNPNYLPRGVAHAELTRLADEGRAVAVVVPGIEEPAWMDASLLPTLERLRDGQGRPTRTTLLSPFDNLIWNRDRAERLWDFHYRLECYVPAPKRRYGYYSLPILDRGRIVGRLDPSFDRRARVLTIKAVHLEPGVRLTESMAGRIRKAISELLIFLGAEPDAWRVLHADPATALPLLRPTEDPAGERSLAEDHSY